MWSRLCESARTGEKYSILIRRALKNKPPHDIVCFERRFPHTIFVIKELLSMPRPKGSKNKKNAVTAVAAVAVTPEEISQKIDAAEADIARLGDELKAKKAELKELIKSKAEAEKIAAEKKAEEEKATIMAAFEKSAKSLDEILEFLK